MKKNIGSADKIVRLLLAVAGIGIYFTDTVTGTWGLVILIVGLILGLTALINFCPIWATFGVKTTPRSES
ncbi:MAG: DUF2892 domain-containing protein [Balneola sp.]